MHQNFLINLDWSVGLDGPRHASDIDPIDLLPTYKFDRAKWSDVILQSDVLVDLPGNLHVRCIYGIAAEQPRMRNSFLRGSHGQAPQKIKHVKIFRSHAARYRLIDDIPGEKKQNPFNEIAADKEMALAEPAPQHEEAKLYFRDNHY